jgi:hypothetical protein
MSPAQVTFVFDSKGLLKKRGTLADLKNMAAQSGGRIVEA